MTALSDLDTRQIAALDGLWDHFPEMGKPSGVANPKLGSLIQQLIDETGQGTLLDELASTTAGQGASLVGIQDVGLFLASTTVEAAFQELGPAFAARIQKKTATIARAALTQVGNGVAQAINIDTALPANARIVAVDAHNETTFTGGGATAVKLDVGVAGDAQALVKQADVFAAAVDGGPPALPLGNRPFKLYAGGGQLIATFTPDGAHALSGLTTGSITIDVFYVVFA